jgi:hypothetical protein
MKGHLLSGSDYALLVQDAGKASFFASKMHPVMVFSKLAPFDDAQDKFDWLCFLRLRRSYIAINSFPIRLCSNSARHKLALFFQIASFWTQIYTD